MPAYRNRLAELQEQRDELDRQISRQIPEMNLQKQLANASRDAIAQALPKGAALVEFVRFNVFNFKAVKANGDSRWQPARYLAFILSASQPDEVRMIDLGEAEPTDELIREFRKSISGERDLGLDCDAETISPETGELYQKLIAPLKPYLQPQQQVFLAPDGELTCLPFGILSASGLQYLMEEYALRYLSVGRDVLRFNFPIPAQPTAPLVIADPDFNLASPEIRQTPPEFHEPDSLHSPDYDSQDSSSQNQPAPNSPSPDIKELSRELTQGKSKRFKPIPGTGIEGARIAQLLNVPAHTDTNALKSLVSRCVSPTILHIATHGFFLESIQEKSADVFEIGKIGRLQHAAQHNPMTRSGLAESRCQYCVKRRYNSPRSGRRPAHGSRGCRFAVAGN